MKSRPITLLLVFSMCVGLLSGCGSGVGSSSSTSNSSGEQSSASGGKQQKVAISHTFSEASPWNKGAQAFADYVNEQSAGRFDAQTYPSGALTQGNWETLLELLQTGNMQIGIEGLSTFGTLLPEIAAFNIPFMFDDWDHVLRFLNSEGTIVDEWKDILAEEHGIYVLALAPREMRQCSSNISIVKTPADLQGLKMRVGNNEHFITVWEALGAKPVPMSANEIYTGIQLGTVNGEENGITTQYDFKTYEVAQNFTLWDYIADGVVMVVSKVFWDSLSAEDQAMYKEAGQKFVETYMDEQELYTEQAMDEMIAAGVKFYEMSEAEREAFRAITDPVMEARYSQMLGKDRYEKFRADIEAVR